MPMPVKGWTWQLVSESKTKSKQAKTESPFFRALPEGVSQIKRGSSQLKRPEFNVGLSISNNLIKKKNPP